MKVHAGLRVPWPLVCLGLWLFLSSLYQVQKYLGNGGVIGYLLGGTLVLGLGYRWVLPAFVAHVSERQARWLAGLTFIALLGLFAVLYPIAKSGTIGGGSDVDDSINRGVREMLAGRYPYYARTYLGNQVAVLPGALLVAAPFVLIGNSAFQSLFWAVAFFGVSRHYLRDSRLALLLSWTIFGLCPAVMQQIVTGGDHEANSIYALIGMLVAIELIVSPGQPIWKKVMGACILGLAFSSRATYLFVIPLVGSAIASETNGWTAAKYIGVTGITWLLLTVPFWWHDPAGFTPLETQNKIARYHSIVPHADRLVPIATGILALVLSLRLRSSDRSALLIRCSAVLAFPVLCVAGLALAAGDSPFWWMAYLVLGLYPGVLGLAMRLVGEPALEGMADSMASLGCVEPSLTG